MKCEYILVTVFLKAIGFLFYKIAVTHLKKRVVLMPFIILLLQNNQKYSEPKTRYIYI